MHHRVPSHARSVRFSTDIECQVVRLRDFRLIADRIVDISRSGMLVSPAAPVLTAEPVLVSFRVPRWGRWVDAEGFVARVVHGRRPGEMHRGLGLSIETMPEPGRYALEQSMRWMPPVLPKLRLGRRRYPRGVRCLLRGRRVA